MDESLTKPPDAPSRHATPDGLKIRWWLVAYFGYLAVLFGAIVVKLDHLGNTWTDLFTQPKAFFLTPAHTALKLLIYVIYLSLACTILPLNTGWLVSALALRDVAVAGDIWTTALVIATVGAVASMIANIHDYHLFTWILRSKSASRIRETNLYHRAERWFSRRPFVLLVAFNVVPIPVDVVRLLAVSYRYPLRPFAVANFLGRWVRYATIAAITFAMGDLGWLVTVALLGLAVVFALANLAHRRLCGASAGDDAEGGLR